MTTLPLRSRVFKGWNVLGLGFHGLGTLTKGIKGEDVLGLDCSRVWLFKG